MALLATTSTFAQITTATPTSTVLKTGNRPEAGTWGIFVGATIDDFKDMSSSTYKFSGMPLVNFKYFYTDNLELRLGLKFKGVSQNLKGEITSDDGEEEGSEKTYEVKSKSVNGENQILPGIAYHFGRSNILDVYVGAEIPIGWNRYKTINVSGDVTSTTKSSPFIVGLCGFIGLQAFVADLPVAVGVEYGISAIKQFGVNKTKTIIENSADAENSQTYFTYGTDKETQYDKLSTSSKNIQNELRVTVSYYFNR